MKSDKTASAHSSWTSSIDFPTGTNNDDRTYQVLKILSISQLQFNLLLIYCFDKCKRMCWLLCLSLFVWFHRWRRKNIICIHARSHSTINLSLYISETHTLIQVSYENCASLSLSTVSMVLMPSQLMTNISTLYVHDEYDEWNSNIAFNYCNTLKHIALKLVITFHENVAFRACSTCDIDKRAIERSSVSVF